MKIRTDFVSNSSSSSFIIKDCDFFNDFNIGRKEIIETIIDLIPENEKKNGKFVVADLKTMRPSRKVKFFKKWDDHFEGWVADREGNWSGWNNLVESIINTDFDVDFKHGKVTKIVRYPDYEEIKDSKIICKFLNQVRKDMRLRTMKAVLHDKDTRFMIHFSDNFIWALKGCMGDDIGKPYTLSDYQWNDSETRKASLKSKWDTEIYTAERFFNVLLTHLIEKYNIDLNSEKFMKYFIVPENHWWKNNPEMKNRKYFIEKPTWKDVFSRFRWNSVLHEG